MQHTDIAATVLDYAGVESAQAMDGRSLLDESAARDHATVAYWPAVVAQCQDGRHRRVPV